VRYWVCEDLVKHRREDVGARRDNITGMERAQIAMEVMPSHRQHVVVSQLAREFEVSRQNHIYDCSSWEGCFESGDGTWAAWCKNKPESDAGRPRACGAQHGGTDPLWGQPACHSDLSGRAVGHPPVVELGKCSIGATGESSSDDQPGVATQGRRDLVWDEIYSNGSPNLLVVGNESLYIYALNRQPACDGVYLGMCFVG